MASDLEVLAPTGVTVKIGGRDFTQRALGLRGTAAVLDLLATTIADTGSFDLFQQIGEVDVSDPTNIDVDKFFPILLRTVRLIPSALPRLIAIILRAPDDEEFLAEEASPIDALRVIKTFAAQNDIPQLVRDFTEVAKLFGETMSQATAGSPNGTELPS